MVALSGELQMAFFFAAILTSSMKLWFVLKVFSACAGARVVPAKAKGKGRSLRKGFCCNPPGPKAKNKEMQKKILERN